MRRRLISSRGVYAEKGVETIVNEVFVTGTWKELADGKWEGVQYQFGIDVHPHESKPYTPVVESEIITALSYPSSVALGEIRLNYHCMLSPPDVQRRVSAQQTKTRIGS
ncbi:hypothetical protein IW262DRAFT_372873 [Armillaria fumosa]|nr:hypothetical protein IW262DRAFT_372873 [Armillaria fumosa]